MLVPPKLCFLFVFGSLGGADSGMWNSTRSRTVITTLSCAMLALTCCACAGWEFGVVGAPSVPVPLWASWPCHPGAPGLVTSAVLPSWSGQPCVWGHCDQKSAALRWGALNFVGIIRGKRLISSHLPFKFVLPLERVHVLGSVAFYMGCSKCILKSWGMHTQQGHIN